MKQLIDLLEEMKGSEISNYVIAGLSSFKVEKGMVRLFENERDHQDQITPHSHRFDFTCLVLQGHVINKIWTECREDEGDFFQVSSLRYSGEIGKHSVSAEGRSYWKYKSETYWEGECYSMTSDELHSIEFSRGAKVLFFEGEEKSTESLIIEPAVNGEVINTYKKLGYMFKVS